MFFCSLVLENRIGYISREESLLERLVKLVMLVIFGFNFI